MGVKPAVAAIVGPTATGKSAVAVEVAARIGCEIVSVDSMQVYRGMDVGTAKIREGERFAANGDYVLHHMIDIADPDADYNVADFQARARSIIREICARDKLPLLVGGTGLYYNATVRDYRFGEDAGALEIRTELMETARVEGNAALYRRLGEVDAAAAERIHPNDLKRVVRALEYYYSTGNPISSSTGGTSPVYRVGAAGLYLPREELYRRINLRVEEMFASGFVDEVGRLLEDGYSTKMNSLQALGYKEVIGYLEGDYDLEMCKELLKRNTRRFAKRQLTWFQRDKSIVWFNVATFRDRMELAAAVSVYFKQELQTKEN